MEPKWSRQQLEEDRKFNARTMFLSPRESQAQGREINKRKNWSASPGRFSPYPAATLRCVNAFPTQEKDVLKTFQDSYERLRLNSAMQPRSESPLTTSPDSEKINIVGTNSIDNRDNNNLSYIGMIATAILSSPETKLTLAGIYIYMEKHFPNILSSRPGWRNTVRHNLSLHDCFMKGEIAAEGKGRFWRIHPNYYEQFKCGKFNKNILQNLPPPYYPSMTANCRCSPRDELSPFPLGLHGSPWPSGLYPFVPPSFPYQASSTFPQRPLAHPFHQRRGYHDLQAFPFRQCPVGFCNSCSPIRHLPALEFGNYAEIKPTLAIENGTFSPIAN